MESASHNDVFSVQADRLRRRLVVKLRGFAKSADLPVFEDDLAKAEETLGGRDGTLQLLYDVSDAQIQSQEIVAALRRIAIRSSKRKAIALVNGSSLAGRQLRRILSGADYREFASFEEAAAWLDAQN